MSEQIEFCYTQHSGMYGISKNALYYKFGKNEPKYFIEMCKNKYGLSISYASDDDVYIYVKESL